MEHTPHSSKGQPLVQGRRLALFFYTQCDFGFMEMTHTGYKCLLPLNTTPSSRTQSHLKQNHVLKKLPGGISRMI